MLDFLVSATIIMLGTLLLKVSGRFARLTFRRRTFSPWPLKVLLQTTAKMKGRQRNGTEKRLWLRRRVFHSSVVSSPIRIPRVDFTVRRLLCPSFFADIPRFLVRETSRHMVKRPGGGRNVRNFYWTTALIYLPISFKPNISVKC